MNTQIRQAQQAATPTNVRVMPYADHVAPYSEEAEEAVLGAILINPDEYLQVGTFLHADDFYFLRHRYIWQALERLIDRGESVDYVTLIQELREQNWLEEIGGAAYLTMLVNNTPTSVHAEFYGKIVQKTATRRRLLIAADEIKALAVNEQMDIETVLREADRRLAPLTAPSATQQSNHVSSIIHNLMDTAESVMAGKKVETIVPIGYEDFDMNVQGLTLGKLHIVAGRPHMGKSQVMYNWAISLAQQGHVVSYFTMDDSEDDVALSMIAILSGLPYARLRTFELSATEYSQFVKASGELAKLRIYIHEGALDPRTLYTKIRALKQDTGCKFVFVDYLQQLQGVGLPGHEKEYERVTYASSSLKTTADRLEVAIVAACQLNRDVEKRKDKRPTTEDLKSSGQIEQDAWLIAGIYRDAVYNDECEFPSQMDWIILKNKGSRWLGTLSHTSDGQTGKIHDGGTRHGFRGDSVDELPF